MAKRKRAIFVVLAVFGLAMAFFVIARAKSTEYEFLVGAEIIEQITKDPRFGGGQRTLYQVRGSAEDVQKTIEAELGHKPSAITPDYSIFKDGDRTIYVGQGRAKRWSDVMAVASNIEKDQFAQELMQRQLLLEEDSSTVAIAVDEPKLKLVENLVKDIARSTAPPPEQFPATTFTYTLARQGKDVVATVDYENRGQLEEEMLVIDAIFLDQVKAEGLPQSILNLKPVSKGTFTITFRNVGPGQKRLRLEGQEKRSGPGYGGRMFEIVQGEVLNVP